MRAKFRELRVSVLVTLLAIALVGCTRQAVESTSATEPAFFKITPTRPIAELLAEAEAATPPVESGEFLPSDLVELTSLEPGIRLDIRYATANNFLSTPIYRQSRAFMQRPAAEALVRVHQALAQEGYGLLVHDAYRPWYVTKLFWDATPVDKHDFVADPATGSRHNRGCAVDLTLYELATGAPVEMPGLYDEMSERSAPDYAGGSDEQRRRRDLLRAAMETQGFSVYPSEWWHFDFRDFAKYRIGNQRFEQIVPARTDSTLSESQIQDLISSLSLPSPFRISDTARAGTIRYWLRVDGEASWPLPETGEQHVERSEQGWTVTVCANNCGRETAPTAAELQQARAPTPWLQSKDPSISMLARSASGNYSQRMHGLEVAVRKQLSLGVDFSNYLTAREAFDARIGDCTEYAVLLAAVVRASGYPARVVAGLAYSTRFADRMHSFGPHMWVQVWDGQRWVSQDAALGAFEAGRIALVVGDGSPESLRGVTSLIRRLHIERAAAVQPPASTPH